MSLFQVILFVRSSIAVISRLENDLRSFIYCPARSMKWKRNSPPPRIQDHSKVKLDLLRKYVRAYIDRLTKPRRDEFKLTLVDGFAGGGIFASKDGGFDGSPIIMLEEGESASERINIDRRKPVEFEIKYRFIEKDKEHCGYLLKTLKERGYEVDDDKIKVINSNFEDVREKIIGKIKSDQPRACRAIFLLDQTGFSHVALRSVKRILEELPQSEVILTFAMGVLVNTLSKDNSLMPAYESIDLQRSRIDEIIEKRDSDRASGNALAQREMLKHIVNSLGHRYFITPFVLLPRSRRSLWFVHISKHPTARNVMVENHWEMAGFCGHYGPGSLKIMGYDSLKSMDQLEIFNFEELELPAIKADLINQFPEYLFELTSESPITVDAFHREIANDTAARFRDIDSVLAKLNNEQEIKITDANRRKRGRNVRKLHPTDQISMPDIMLLPGISRRQK